MIWFEIWQNDYDKDGLYYYEEIEIGTDPTDPDTDNDGYRDGKDFDPLDKNVGNKLTIDKFSIGANGNSTYPILGIAFAKSYYNLQTKEIKLFTYSGIGGGEDHPPGWAIAKAWGKLGFYFISPTKFSGEISYMVNLNGSILWDEALWGLESKIEVYNGFTGSLVEDVITLNWSAESISGEKVFDNKIKILSADVGPLPSGIEYIIYVKFNVITEALAGPQDKSYFAQIDFFDNVKKFSLHIPYVIFEMK